MAEMGFVRVYEHEETEDDDDLTRLVRQIGWVVGTDREGKTRYHYDLETARNLLGNYVAAQVAKAREEVDAMLWTTERVMGADAADAMRRWLDDYRATGRLVVRDAGGAEIEHFPDARA